MKYAWIENNQIRDVAWSDPNNIYHPDVAKLYDTQVPDNAVNGDRWVNGQLVKPTPPAPPAPAPKKWSVDDFRNGMTMAEKVKWDNNSAPEIITAKAELPKEQAGAQEVVDLLVAAGVISQASAAKIME